MKETNLVATTATAPTMTSLEIAEVTGKLHKDVLRAIRKMESAWEKTLGRKFALQYKINKLATGGKVKQPYYSLTKTECLYIATKFNDEARARLILRWEELETAQSDYEQLRMSLAQAEETIARLRQTVSGQLEDLKTQSDAIALILNSKINDNSLNGKLDFVIGCLGQMLKFYRPEPEISSTKLAKILSDLKSIEKGGAR